METVLYYEPLPLRNPAAIAGIFQRYGLRVVQVARDQVGQSIGFLAGYQGFQARPSAGTPPEDRILVFCEVAGDTLDAVLEALKAADAEGETVEAVVTDAIHTLGENIQLSRFALVEGGAVSSYIHGGGKIGVIVGIKTDASADEIAVCAKDVAMQVASMSPKFVDDNQVDQAWLESEKEIAKQQLLNEGKPEAMLERIIPGKVKAILKEVCLVDQKFVKNSDMTVAQYVESVAKEIGKPMQVVEMVRYEVGEGIEKKEENFAEEVAKQMGK